MIEQIKPLLGKLCAFSQKRMGFSHPPKLFLKSDSKNAEETLGKTAYYDPQNKSITLFVVGRHPKDILRSFSHELVHHTQNLRGDLAPEKMTSTGANYAQECPHMRNMEKEAYLQGNMCFRDWEDQHKLTISESKFLKENKTMTTKITKEFLRETIRKTLQEQVTKVKQTNTMKTAPTEKELAAKDAAKAEAELQAMLAKKRADRRKAAGSGDTATATTVPEGLEENEELEERKQCCGKEGCPGPGKPHSGKYAIQENEELEEKQFAKDDSLDGDKDGKPKWADPDDPANESKIQTPEQENTLYEQRFTSKNNRLFKKLIKEWTK